MDGDLKAAAREMTPLEAVRSRNEALASQVHEGIDRLEVKLRQVLPGSGEPVTISEPSGPPAAPPGTSEAVRHLDAVNDVLDRAVTRLALLVQHTEV